MPTLFHGTGDIDAHAMASGTIDVSLAGGELGRGFYTQYSQRRALGWAYRRGPHINGNPCVLRIDIDDQEYGLLQILYLNVRSGPALTLFLEETTQKYLFIHSNGYDLLEGPIMGRADHTQQKFESQEAEDLLNDASTTRTVV